MRIRANTGDGPAPQNERRTRTLYVVAPEVHAAQAIVEALAAAIGHDRHIRVLARRDAMLEGLREAPLLERSDLKWALGQGVVIGGLAGLVCGLFAMAFPAATLGLGWLIVVATTVGGAAFGAWVSGMMGIGGPNRRFHAFEAVIEHGAVLVLIDLPETRVETIRQQLRNHRPEIDLGTVVAHRPWPLARASSR